VYNTGKGYAFVTFDRKEDAETATMAMDGQTLAGQQIKVKYLPT
jgi:RNA recognition motif-containing protein